MGYKLNPFTGQLDDVGDTSSSVLVMNRFGGTGTTGSSQVFTSSTATNVTGSNVTFTLPDDGKPVKLDGRLPLLLANATASINIDILVSKDNTNWVTASVEYVNLIALATNGLGLAYLTGLVSGVIPQPNFDTSASAPNDATPGDTIYAKLAVAIAGCGVNYRGPWSASNSYAVGDGVVDSGLYYVCKLARSATATHPASDTSYWIAVSVTAFLHYSGLFGGYLDTYLRAVRN